MKHWFADWFDSPYYHELYSDRNNAEADLLINCLFQHLKVPSNSKVLDLACGTGRHAIAMLNNGVNVTGIDLSLRMIAEAKNLECDHLNFYQHDMRNMLCINYFDYVFNLFTSFGYFNSDKENYLTAKHIILNLKKGGFLVIDYFNKEYVLKNLISEEKIQIGNNEFQIHRKLENNFLQKTINVQTPERNFQYMEKVRVYSFAEFVMLFQSLGSTLVEVKGDYELSKYEEKNSPRMICIFKKNE